MHTIGAQTCPVLINPRDIHLLEMLEGAFRPPDEPPTEATHDFLVLNPNPDLAVGVPLVSRNCSGGL